MRAVLLESMGDDCCCGSLTARLPHGLSTTGAAARPAIGAEHMHVSDIALHCATRCFTECLPVLILLLCLAQAVDPTNGFLWHTRGLLAQQQGQLDEAMAAFMRGAQATCKAHKLRVLQAKQAADRVL